MGAGPFRVSSKKPPGYVRGTERRNVECFLDLLARGAIPVSLLVSDTFPVTAAPDVYGRLGSGELPGIGYLFEYPPAVTTLDGRPASVALPASVRRASPALCSATDQLRVGFIGAGSYARSVLLPLLARRPAVQLAHVVTSTSLGAANAQRRFGFRAASTDVDGLLGDEEVDVVFVVTRHHSHAALVCRSLEAGKPTYVEKPLALSERELTDIIDVVNATGNDRLMVGFNRRFAPLLAALRERFGDVPDGAMIQYHVNAGTLGANSWYRNTRLEGSRFDGEGGHFLDTIGWWLGANPLEVRAWAAGSPDDLHVVIRYDNGSVGTIDYVTQGGSRYPKETMVVSAGGRTARFDNFARATVWRGRRRATRRAWSIDKGQSRQLDAFLDAVRHGSPMPIPLAVLTATTAATFAVRRSLDTGQPITL